MAAKARGEVAVTHLSALVEEEEATRRELIDWEPPTPELALEKMLCLLAHVLAGKVAFDEQALSTLRAQIGQLQVVACAGPEP